MNHFSLLVKLTEQMYQDIRFVAENNPTQVVDDESTRMFNAVLAQLKLTKPQASIFTMFVDMNPRTLKYKDALVVVGQLRCTAKALDESAEAYSAMISKANSEGQQSGQKKNETENPANNQNSSEKDSLDDSGEAESIDDEELYGTKSLRINEEGIVPFDLSDS